MPRYFFHLSNDVTVEDEEGQICADDAEARLVAIREARELIADSIAMHGRVVLSHSIEVHDENGPRFTLRFGDAFEVVP